MSLTRPDLLKLLRLVDVTQVDEIDCSELLRRAGGYLEGLGPDGAPPAGYEDVVGHLRICQECLEEIEALRRALRAER